MADISTIYTYFSAIDFKGTNSLSSYALPQTPLRFVSDYSQDTRTKIVWNFGDGTTSRNLTASKSYDFPGQYEVNLVVYDCYDNALISTFTKTITVYDFIPFTFNIDINSDTIQNGKIEGPWLVNAYYPPYQPVSNIFYSVSGSDSVNYWDIEDQKFSHLEAFHTLYQKVSNYHLSSYQYDEIDKVEMKGIPLYGKIYNNNIVSCLSSDINSFYLGTSAQKEVYFRDDLVSGDVNVSFFFDKNNNYIQSRYKPNPQNFINNMKVTLALEVTENTDVDHLSITSNGLDGEGYPVTSFDISPIKFYEAPIPFVIKIKDIDDYSIKNFPPIEINDVFLSINGSQVIQFLYLQPDGVSLYVQPDGLSLYYGQLEQGYSLSSLNVSLSTQNHGGAIRSYIKFSNQTTVLSNVMIVAQGSYQNNQGNTFTISGSSSKFNLYPKNYYDIYKYNEDVDMSKTIKDLRFQDSLKEGTEVLFDEFLGTIFGNAESSYNSLGKKTYEKIANFVQNISDVDTVEREQLVSMVKMMGADVDEGDAPENVKRLINLLSISKNKLFGTGNKFDSNFDIRGRTSKDEYGTNLGNQIDNSTYIISAGTPIVALEKFSNQYTLLNTMQPVEVTGNRYQLSAYSSNWGWPLVLPNQFTYKDFEKYYIFFEYTPQFDSHLKGGVIDFGNTQTTVPSTVTYNQMFDRWGIADNMISYTLYDSLSLFDIKYPYMYNALQQPNGDFIYQVGGEYIFV